MNRTQVASYPSILMQDYISGAEATDRLSASDLQPILLGLFGEIGSVMATAKKHKREGDAFIGYRQAVEDELGDALWYFTALCKRLEIGINEVISAATSNGKYTASVVASDSMIGSLSEISIIATLPPIDDVLLRLGTSVSNLLTVSRMAPGVRDKLIDFADSYLHAVQASGITFAEIAQSNLTKVRGRFLKPDPLNLPTFDSSFPEDERIPDEFEIEIRERKSGQSYLRMNGVFIGTPLKDNIRDPDGYRFHDVFHFAYAAVLHWSPTFRALIKHKRKSDPVLEEAQDSGRPIVVEEGLSAWIFSRAKLLNFFENQDSVSFDLLKTISQFVSGYEVEACPLKLWEEAILQGYSVFRQIKGNGGGIVIGDRINRRIKYKSLQEK